MPCVKRTLVALAMLAVVVFTPRVSFAASTCDCFCGEAGYGATPMGTMQQSSCSARCDDLEIKFIGCFSDPSQYPVESDKCWTKAECAAWSDERNGTTVKATWGSVFPAECSVTKTSGEEMRYCYAEDVPYDLNIAIGNVSTVQNLPEYINLVYTWMLPAASLIAVVMMMIGGLQYTLARGKSKYIEKAKTRITNAITGIVILMSAFVILNLIDPRLVSFESLNIPLIKEVVILDPEASCERLEDYGYDIDPLQEATDDGYKQCGGYGEIVGTDNLADNALGSWKEGDTCEYQSCASGESCVADDGKNSCQSCSAMPSETSSTTTCSAMEQLNTGAGGDEQRYCRYSPELRACLGVSGDSPGVVKCSSMQTLSKNNAAYPGCKYYETLNVVYNSGVSRLSTEDHKDFLKEICNNDPCGLAKNVGATRCAYNEGASVESYFGITSTTPGFYCNTF